MSYKRADLAEARAALASGHCTRNQAMLVVAFSTTHIERIQAVGVLVAQHLVESGERPAGVQVEVHGRREESADVLRCGIWRVDGAYHVHASLKVE